MIRRRLSVIGLLSALQAVSAHEPTAERPIYVPGDTWQYAFANNRYAKPGCLYSLKVERVTKSNVFSRVSFPNGCEVSITTAYPVASESLQRFDLSFNHFHYSADPYRAFDFPLHVGKKWNQKWEWKLNGWTYNDDVSAVVEGFEKVTTRAGSFDAFRIRLVRDYRGTRIGYVTQVGALEDTFWYAPAVKNFVKRRYLDRGWADITRELTSYEVR